MFYEIKSKDFFVININKVIRYKSYRVTVISTKHNNFII